MSHEYDRRAQAWVKNRFGVVPDLGSVEFSNDCAAYTSGGWANVDVSWTANGRPGGSSLSESAWQFEWTEVIRELVDTEPLTQQPSAEQVSVSKPALDALITYANEIRMRGDWEFCCSVVEREASKAEFGALVGGLALDLDRDIIGSPEG